MSRPGSEARLRRILAVVPWVVAEDGPALAEVCARFGYRTQAELQQDLDLLFLCGVPPYSPDTLIEVDVADGRVWIRYADWFERPLRLTPAEALTLVASSSALLGSEAATDFTDLDGPLARGLAKLATSLGLREEVLDVTLGPAPADELAVLLAASRDHHQVEIEYYVYGRDEITTRVIDPHLVYSAAGQWYVAAYCHTAAADRLFRVDRVRRVTVLDRPFEPRPGGEVPPLFAPGPTDPELVIEVEPEATWVATQYPATSVTVLPEGRARVSMPISGDAWLARLLLRLGRDARVVEGDVQAVTTAASRLTARYRKRPSQPIVSRGHD
jgi:proteasome accessory factor C